mmetsp:Transcript_82239/g.220729  ORF Transcript_82239/g.220729 Transcript_82239/m.220729 type:complete len:81 (-) Transcript_82239:324-566(-)
MASLAALAARDGWAGERGRPNCGIKAPARGDSASPPAPPPPLPLECHRPASQAGAAVEPVLKVNGVLRRPCLSFTDAVVA